MKHASKAAPAGLAKASAPPAPAAAHTPTPPAGVPAAAAAGGYMDVCPGAAVWEWQGDNKTSWSAYANALSEQLEDMYIQDPSSSVDARSGPPHSPLPSPLPPPPSTPPIYGVSSLSRAARARGPQART